MNNSGETPVDIILQNLWVCCLGTPVEQSSIGICSDLISAGGYLTSVGVFKCRQLAFYSPETLDAPTSLIIGMPTFVVGQIAGKIEVESIELPEKFAPVFSQSEQDLERLLKSGADMTEVMEYYTQWPRGLEILLNSGLAPSHKTLSVALAADYKESIKLLLQTKNLCIGPQWLQTVSCSRDVELLELATQELVSRRKRLRLLAETYLPSTTLSRLRIQPDRLLNSAAADVYRSLKALSIDIGFAESEISWIVYSHIGSNITLADLLWKAGFRDMDERDDNDYTSLMNLSTDHYLSGGPVGLLEKAQWLITRGADPHLTRESLPAVLYMCYDLGLASYCNLEHLVSASFKFCDLSDRCLGLVRRILFDPCRDTCSCSYSPNGCSGLSRFMDAFFWNITYRKVDGDVYEQLAVALEDIAGALCSSCPQGIFDAMAPDVIRFITAHALQITHTCVCDRWGACPRSVCEKLQEDEITELSFVEHDLLQQHEDLFGDFLAKYKKGNEPLPRFITGYWSTKMRQALSFDNASPEEQAMALREIGVVLDSNADTSNSFESG
ncbi:hypothetical protein P170DRAFT_480726 [Aspergillus steynii IBT 23096]|uniref:Uncharacterized protein n=1 Tax=Aspergillus steynii IBT 23096 TaxID=1392250 RepID=A0A2I2FT66_9EURO|nr:uncharacterized protein P170DRAFT_480726 [Aspergillus steynii IBT 23096]PLB43767.1 hypothetical protein P170DRAFT_480726 [Aspergillus steynii IBT 23096]